MGQEKPIDRVRRELALSHPIGLDIATLATRCLCSPSTTRKALAALRPQVCKWRTSNGRTVWMWIGDYVVPTSTLESSDAR